MKEKQEGIQQSAVLTGRYWQVLAGTGRYWQVLAGTGRYWQVSNGACDTTMMTSNRKFTERETVMISNNRAHGRIHIASKIAHSTKQQQDMCKQQRKISHRAYGWNRAPSGKQHPGD